MKIEKLPTLQRRLALEADLRGNADGVVTEEEMRALAAELGSELVAKLGLEDARDRAIDQLLGTIAGHEVETLAPALRKLPEPMRRLVLQLDAIWGNADGSLSLAELDRVAGFYLKAAPYFTADASALLELATSLGYDDPPAGNLLQLRQAQARAADPDAGVFGEIFREVLHEAGLQGLPELVTSPSQHFPTYHQWGILEHTAAAVSAIRELAHAIDFEWQRAGAVMLLHDVGKILNREVEMLDGTPHVWFAGHAHIGADWLAAHGLDPELVNHVRYHESIRVNDAQETIDWCGGDPRRVAEAILVYCADQIGKGNRPDQLASFDNTVPKLRDLASFAGIDLDRLLQTRSELLS